MNRGRPKKDSCRTRVVKLRLTEEEYQRLTEFAEEANWTKSDVIRHAVDIFCAYYRPRKSLLQMKGITNK